MCECSKYVNLFVVDFPKYFCKNKINHLNLLSGETYSPAAHRTSRDLNLLAHRQFDHTVYSCLSDYA